MAAMAAATAGAQGLQAVLGWLSERNQRKQQKKNQQRSVNLAKQGTSDAYGNTARYGPNGWEYNITPESQQVMDAELQELINNLTLDAPQNRAFRDRVFDIGQTATGDLSNVLNEYRYGERPNEAQYIDDLTRELMIGRKKGIKEGQSTLGRQALRMNQAELLPQLIEEADRLYGSTLEESILKGKRLGAENFRAADSHRNNQLGSQIDRFYRQATNYPQAPVRDSNMNENLSSMFQNANTNLGNAFGGMSAFSSPAFPVGDVMGSIEQTIKALRQPSGGYREEDRKAYNLPLK